METKAKSRIVGVTLGEAHLNFVKANVPPLTADFALVRDDGEYCGLVQRRLEWSERTIEAFTKLRLEMEHDMLGHLFEPEPSDGQAEPEQV